MGRTFYNASDEGTKRFLSVLFETVKRKFFISGVATNGAQSPIGHKARIRTDPESYQADAGFCNTHTIPRFNAKIFFF